MPQYPYCIGEFIFTVSLLYAEVCEVSLNWKMTEVTKRTSVRCVDALQLPKDYKDSGVPELWIYRQGTRHIHCFDGQPYHEQESSPLCPTIPVQQLIPRHVEQAWLAGSNVALHAFEADISSNDPT